LTIIVSSNIYSQIDSTDINIFKNLKKGKNDTIPSISLNIKDTINTLDTITQNNLTSKSSNNNIFKDSIVLKKSPDALNNIVNYEANDSIRFDLKNKKAFLFNKANLKYENIILESDFVEINMAKNELYASGAEDSSGTIVGKPQFKEDDQTFRTEKISYNFNTKKGIINTVITQEGEGYMHGEKVKKFADNTTFVKNGKYTTCNLDHPHFELSFARAKVIPNEIIVTGPAYLKIEGIPTPIGIPFGFFPNKKGRKSGIIIPSYGEAENRGFYFENGGFYWGINDNIDLAILGDIYTRGSWATKLRSNYNLRYKYNGFAHISYATNILGEKNTESYQKYKDFMFKWTHNQDPKAHPVRRFSANVNIMSSKYNLFNPTSANDYLSNTFQSAVSFSTNWKGKYFLSANLSHSQNTITRQMTISLPEVSFSVSSFYPFRKEKSVSNFKWYENISVGYSSYLKNTITTYDSIIFEGNFLDKMNNGIRHSIPISNSIKIFKYFNFTNRIDYTELWYSRAIEKTFEYLNINDTLYPNIKNDTLYGFKTARFFSYSSSISTKFYGLINFNKSKIKAIRHVVTPTLNFVYHPDFSKYKYGYYKYHYDLNGILTKYSIYGSNIYGVPPAGKSGQLNLNIANNLEMKIKTNSDSIESKKIILIENLSFATAIDFTKDSLQFIPLSISGRTTLFKNLYINYYSVWDPYYKNENGIRIDETEYKNNKRLFRMTQSDWNFSFNYLLTPQLFEKKEPQSTSKTSTKNRWSLNLSYNLFYTKKEETIPDKYTDATIQTIAFTAEINITNKWKISGSSGYDFKNKEISYTSIDFYRDLHCWEMRFNWIPLGYRKSWNFTINVKSSILQDLKYVKKKDFRDDL